MCGIFFALSLQESQFSFGNEKINQMLDSVIVKNIPLIICGGIDIFRDENLLKKKSESFQIFSGFAASTSFLIK